jgi:hypothetical protein
LELRNAAFLAAMFVVAIVALGTVPWFDPAP